MDFECNINDTIFLIQIHFVKKYKSAFFDIYIFSLYSINFCIELREEICTYVFILMTCFEGKMNYTEKSVKVILLNFRSNLGYKAQVRSYLVSLYLFVIN